MKTIAGLIVDAMGIAAAVYVAYAVGTEFNASIDMVLSALNRAMGLRT